MEMSTPLVMANMGSLDMEMSTQGNSLLLMNKKKSLYFITTWSDTNKIKRWVCLPSVKDYVTTNDQERATQCLLLDVCLFDTTSHHFLQ